MGGFMLLCVLHLQLRLATCYPSFMEQLASYATTVESSVQQDGKVVTSRGPGTTMQFAVALIEQLYGKDKADVVSGPLVMRPNDGDEYTITEPNPLDWKCNNIPQGGLDGAQAFANSDKLVNLLKKQAESNKPYSAICVSPALVLEPIGLLKILSEKRTVCKSREIFCIGILGCSTVVFFCYGPREKGHSFPCNVRQAVGSEFH